MKQGFKLKNIRDNKIQLETDILTLTSKYI